MTEFLTESDLVDVCEIEKVCFGKDAWNLSMLQGEYDGGSVFLGIKQNNKVVAYTCARLIFDEADINNVAVLPDFRKKGYAWQLVMALIDFCKQKNIHRFTLEVNANNLPAKNLYKKIGFESCGVRKGYYHGEDAEIMWLEGDNV